MYRERFSNSIDDKQNTKIPEVRSNNIKTYFSINFLENFLKEGKYPSGHDKMLDSFINLSRETTSIKYLKAL